MRIVITAPIEEPVPPTKYGGTELVVYNLCQHMVRKGHEVFLLAAGDSHTNAKLVPLVTTSLRKKYSNAEIEIWRNFWKTIQTANALKEIKRLQPDIVFNHQGWRFVPFIQFVNCPVFTTIHGPLTSPSERTTYHMYPKTALISISEQQRRAMPEGNWVKTIYNGIELQKTHSVPITKRDYFAFLGRTSPEKGLKEICEMIKKTPHRLKIAAKVDTADQQYFEQQIKPLIDGQQIEFIGEIGPDQKTEFLSHAKGLLLWLNWEEPFGLVIVEAMAAGTPALANPRGAMKELIKDGETGYLVDSLEQMAHKMDQVEKIMPQHCIDHVAKNFSAQKMTQEYLKLLHD